MTLEDGRHLIDALDRDIVYMLRRRIELVDMIADAKTEAGIPALDLDRAREVVEKAVDCAGRIGAPEVLVGRVYAVLVTESADYQRRRDRIG